MSALRAGYIIPSLQKPSGWRSHAVALLGAIREYVEPVLFVAPEDRQQAAEIFPDLPVFNLPTTQGASLGSRSGMRKLWQTYRTIQRSSYPDLDLVHSLEAYPAGLVGVWLAGRLRRPHAITTHGTYGVVWFDRLPDRWAYQQVLRRTQLVCPVSHGTARLVERYFGASLGKACIRPILNGNSFYRTVPREVALAHTPPPVPTLLSVGDVKPRKGQLISLQAFEKVRQRLPEARYEIIGRAEGRYTEEMRAYIEAHGLQQAVTIHGTVSDEQLKQAYQNASVFVLTPQEGKLHFEGFGLVYLEAGAYGLPVVGTRSGGVPDAVKDGVTGLLADENDVEGIAQAILRLLEDPQLARRMGQANRQWAEALTWESAAREQVEAYREILGEKDGRPA